MSLSCAECAPQQSRHSYISTGSGLSREWRRRTQDERGPGVLRVLALQDHGRGEMLLPRAALANIMLVFIFMEDNGSGNPELLDPAGQR